MPCKLISNEYGVFLVFENEDEAEEAAKIYPEYLRITSFGQFMNALQLAQRVPI